jgi:transposase-like protein
LLKIEDYKVVYGGYKAIRQALVQRSQEEFQKFAGTSEVDESYFGGQFKNLRKNVRKELREKGQAKRGRGAKYRKQPVFGIYRRDGKIYLELISDAQKPILEKIIKERIKKGEEVFSDTHTGYQGLVGLGYIHGTVNHSKEEYVSGRIHINGIEGFWGLSKTNMHTYKGIKKRNWNEYLKEMEFRYNYRDLEFDDLAIKVVELLSCIVRKHPSGS